MARHICNFVLLYIYITILSDIVKTLLRISVYTAFLLFVLVLPVSAAYVWENSIVEEGNSAFYETSLAFDGDDNPTISSPRSNAHELKYFECAQLVKDFRCNYEKNR